MRSIAVTLNSLEGEVTIALASEAGVQTLKMMWGRDQDECYGFKASFHSRLIRLTEVSAPIFIGQLVSVLREVAEIDVDNCTIINECGEELEDIQFLPPTFLGDSDDILILVQAQESLMRVHHTFERSGRRLTSGLLDYCAQEGVLEDFLTLIESKLSGIHFNLDCLVEEQ